MLHGRNYCIADDVHDLTVAVLAHRIRLAAHAEGWLNRAATSARAPSAIWSPASPVPL